MYQMEQCWRWYGPDDPVTLKDIKQTGATGIVTALHHIPFGEAWTLEEILKRKNQVEKKGFTWSVVESIPVHEDIKTRSGNFKRHIENYKSSIRNLAKAGIPVVTYNFMPVNDWTRTSLSYQMPDGSHALYFNWADLAIFDIYILKRPSAQYDYQESILKEVENRYRQLSQKDLDMLADVVMAGIPGEERNTAADMLQKIQAYKDIDRKGLRQNLSEFQKEISHAAEEAGVLLAIHPDDPPFPLFGLPRVVSTIEDFEYLFSKVDLAANGVCFCTGSLGARKDNNLPDMMRRLNSRIHFLHLRNVRKDASGNFFEADHLDGDNDMYTIVKEALLLMQRQKKSIPFRPDHGHQMLDDLNKKSNPGYSAIGRMRGLAEIRGLELGIMNSLKE
jgi:mannonate dehydratase